MVKNSEKNKVKSKNTKIGVELSVNEDENFENFNLSDSEQNSSTGMLIIFP